MIGGFRSKGRRRRGVLNNSAGDDEFVGSRFLDQEGQSGLDDAGVPFGDKGVLIAVCELEGVLTCLDTCKYWLNGDRAWGDGGYLGHDFFESSASDR